MGERVGGRRRVSYTNSHQAGYIIIHRKQHNTFNCTPNKSSCQCICTYQYSLYVCTHNHTNLFVALLPHLSKHLWSELTVTHSFVHHIHLLIQQSASLQTDKYIEHVTTKLNTKTTIPYKNTVTQLCLCLCYCVTADVCMLSA